MCVCVCVSVCVWKHNYCFETKCRFDKSTICFLKSEMDASNVLCERIYAVFNGIRGVCFVIIGSSLLLLVDRVGCAL